MVRRLFSSNLASNTSSTDIIKTVADTPTVLRAIYGAIGALAILSNGFFCFVILKTPRMLRSSYNVLVLSLALTDTATGIFIISSPIFVIGNKLMPIPSGLKGEFFCRIVQRNFFVWALANFSVAVVMSMAIERWYAIARPRKYQILLTKKNTVRYVFVLLAFSISVNIPQLFETHLETKTLTPICAANFLGGRKMASFCYTIVYCMISAFIPFILIIASYIDLRFLVRQQRQSQRHTRPHIKRQQQEMVLLRMAAVIALFLGITFIPDKIAYFLFWFDVVKWDVLNGTAILCMINSILNPWIYCLTNKVYRKEFIKILFPKRRRNAAVIDVSVIKEDANSAYYSGRIAPALYITDNEPVQNSVM